MPRHLISDAHEWINEIPTVPIYYLAIRTEAEKAIGTSHPDKASENTLTFRILQLAFPQVGDWITTIYNACIMLEHCPNQFRRSNTVVLRKLGKNDYTQPRPYRT